MLSENGRSERASEMAKAMELWLGRVWLSVWGVVGECGGWFAFIRTWGERPLSIILSGAVLLFISKFILSKNLIFAVPHLFYSFKQCGECSIAFLLRERGVDAFKGLLWIYVKLGAGGMSERLAGAKGASRAGACYLCESGRERRVGRAERALVGCGNVGTGKHGWARKFICVGRACGCGVSAPT